MSSQESAMAEWCSVEDRLPPCLPIELISGIDRYGCSAVMAQICGRTRVPRSFANWVHGWIWADEPTAELLHCGGLARDTTIIARNRAEKFALQSDGFSDVRVGGLPFAYVRRQHLDRNMDDLLAFPPHSAEAERITVDQADYMDYLESLKTHFNRICVSVHYLDMGGALHKAALARGLRVIEGARPDDANSLFRIRAMLDSFLYVTSNSVGSHMLYALFSGCKFSFCGPMYCYDESVLLAGGNPHNHSEKLIRSTLYYYSEFYLRKRFGVFFVDHPRAGVRNLDFAAEEIGANSLMDVRQLESALGWSLQGQINGYLSGARRRVRRVIDRR